MFITFPSREVPLLPIRHLLRLVNNLKEKKKKGRELPSVQEGKGETWVTGKALYILGDFYNELSHGW